MMDKNKKVFNIQFILWTLLGFIIGIGISISCFSIILRKEMSLYEIFSILANLFIVLTAIIAILFTIQSLKIQKKHWLNENFIKHEADILLMFRKKIGEANNSINFFLHNLLNVDKKYAFLTENPPIIKYDELKENFNCLVELNNLYNSYQNIFRKHQLEKKIECISLLLESARYIAPKDISYLLIENTNNSQTYRMEQKVLVQIISSFNFSAHNLHDVKPNHRETINEMNKYNELDKISELNRLKELTAQELNSLVFKLDELTTYIDSKYPSSLNSRNLKYFQKK